MNVPRAFALRPGEASLVAPIGSPAPAIAGFGCVMSFYLLGNSLEMGDYLSEAQMVTETSFIFAWFAISSPIGVAFRSVSVRWVTQERPFVVRVRRSAGVAPD
jgi:hypothetical protein